MSNTENKTFQNLQIMPLFFLLRDYGLEEQGQRYTAGVWTGSQWHPCAMLPCIEMKEPAQSKRMYSRFLKRSECNHSSERYYASLRLTIFLLCIALPKIKKLYTNKYSCELVWEQPQQFVFPWEVQMRFLTIPSLGLQRELAPKQKQLLTGSSDQRVQE